MRALQPFRIRVAGTDANHPPVCAECGRQPRDDENPADEWRAYLYVDDDLPVFCPECAGREFDEAWPPRSLAVGLSRK